MGPPFLTAGEPSRLSREQKYCADIDVEFPKPAGEPSRLSREQKLHVVVMVMIAPLAGEPSRLSREQKPEEVSESGYTGAGGPPG